MPLFAKIVDDQVYKHEPEWRYYMNYNQIRGSLNDNPNFTKLFEADSDYSVANLNDLQNLANFIADPAILKLQTIVDVKQSLDIKPFFDKLQNVETWICSYIYTIVCVLLLVLLLLSERMATYRWGGLLSGLLFFILLSWVSLNATVKERVFLAAIIPLMLIIVLIIACYQ